MRSTITIVSRFAAITEFEKADRPDGASCPLQHRITQKSGYRPADRLLVHGLRITARHQGIDVIVGHDHGHRTLAPALSLSLWQAPLCVRHHGAQYRCSVSTGGATDPLSARLRSWPLATSRSTMPALAVTRTAQWPRRRRARSVAHRCLEGALRLAAGPYPPSTMLAGSWLSPRHPPDDDLLLKPHDFEGLLAGSPGVSRLTAFTRTLSSPMPSSPSVIFSAAGKHEVYSHRWNFLIRVTRARARTICSRRPACPSSHQGKIER
jgi:hypothetical protein